MHNIRNVLDNLVSYGNNCICTYFFMYYFNKYFLNSKSSNDNIKNLINMLTIFNGKLLLGTYYI